jgi:alanine racemase
MFRRTAAHISLEAIRANHALTCSLAPQGRVIAVVKAHAYGHGLVQVARALSDEASAFAVATVDEALALRGAAIENPLLVLEGAESTDACDAASEARVSLMVHSLEQVEMALGYSMPVWIKVDTGMHRLGIEPEELPGVVERLRGAGIEVQVLSTHLACADELDNEATRRQLASFRECTRGIDLPLSIANSAAIVGWPESHAEWNRPGLMLYGVSPFAQAMEELAGLRPAMRFTANVIALRDVPVGESVGYGGCWTAQRPSRIATLAAGYADGYPRHAPDGTPTFINGHIAPLVGAVSMDMITVDVTDHPDVAVGDSAELWGPNVPVNEVAASAGTIGYALLTGVSARVPRIYT